MSGFVKNALPQRIASQLAGRTNYSGNCNIVNTLKDSFKTVHRDLRDSDIAEYSGTTCCTVLFKGKILYSANVGDSRAIIIK